MKRRLHILISVIFAGFLLAGCAAGKIRVVTGDLSGNITWSDRVAIHGDIVLEEGSVLTIAPGTEVVFFPAGARDLYVDHPNFPGSELIIRGRIVADGTRERPITFRFADPAAPAGSWGGINLAGSQESSFSFTRFQQANSAIHSQESTLYIEQSIFEKNLVAIRFHSSKILIENNLIRNNGSGIRFHFGAPVICKNKIIDNGKGLFITSHPRDYRVENNTFSGNDRNVVLGEEVPENVTLTNNFWGSVDAESIRHSFFDGQVESYLGKVIFEPLRAEPDPNSGVQWK